MTKKTPVIRLTDPGPVPGRASTLWSVAAAGLLVAGAAVFECGCSSTPDGVPRLARYQPDVQEREPWKWTERLPETADGGSITSTQLLAELTATQATDVAISIFSPNGIAGEGSNAVPSSAAEEAEYQIAMKPLHRGDKIKIYLTGIPQQLEIEDVIDETGKINLPLIGVVVMQGKTASEAEVMIEKRYISDGYYRKITVIVVPQQGEYFVLGEVKRGGKYLIAGEITLLQAVAEASGFTDFANAKRVEVKRGQER